MKIEILAGGGIKTAFEELGIEATMIYRGSNKPHYQVWEIEKSDLSKLEEPIGWKDHFGWWSYAKRSNMGTAADFFTINGQFMIGWETEDRTDTYDSLTDYFYNGLGVRNHDEICALAVDLGRVNGMSLCKLFNTFEG